MPITSSTSSKQLVCKPVLSDSIRKEGTQTRSAPVDTSASDTDTPSVIEKGWKKEGRQKQSDRNEHRKSGGVEGIRNISQASLLNTHSIETAGRASANDDSPGGNDQSDPGQQVKSKSDSDPILQDSTRKEDGQVRSASICTSAPDTDSPISSVIEKRRVEKGKQRQRDGSEDRASGGIRSTSRAPLPNMHSTETAKLGGAHPGRKSDVSGGSSDEKNQGDPGQPSQSSAYDDEADGFVCSADPSQPRKFPLKPESENPWAATYKRVEILDNDACSSWKDEIDKLLVFAGLFSAAVTAFTVEAYQWLDDPNDNTATRSLDRISQQLAHTTGIPAVEAKPFKVPSWVIRVNIFWFLSLILSLNSVLIGILCLQWVREFQRDVTHLTHKEALVIRQVRYLGLLGWKVPQIISMLPLLLQLAMILFFIGVVDFLFAKNQVVAFCALVPILLGIGFYFFTCLAPGIQLRFGTWEPWSTWDRSSKVEPPNACPYKSPLALLFCRIFSLGKYYSWLEIDKYYRRGWSARNGAQPATAALLIWLRENLFQEWASLVDIVACFRSCNILEQTSVFRLKYPSSKIMWEDYSDLHESRYREWLEWLFLRWTPQHSSPDGLQAATELWLRGSSGSGLEMREHIQTTAELNPIIKHAYQDSHFIQSMLTKQLEVGNNEVVYYMPHNKRRLIILALRTLCVKRPANWKLRFTKTLDYIVLDMFCHPVEDVDIMLLWPVLIMGDVISSCFQDGHNDVVASYSQACVDMADMAIIVDGSGFREKYLGGRIRFLISSGKLKPWIYEDESGQIVEQPGRLIGDKTKEEWLRLIREEWMVKGEAEREKERLERLHWFARLVNPVIQRFSHKAENGEEGVDETGGKTIHSIKDAQEAAHKERPEWLHHLGRLTGSVAQRTLRKGKKVEPTPPRGDIEEGSMVEEIAEVYRTSD